MQKLLVPANGSGSMAEASLDDVEQIDLVDRKRANPLPAAASVQVIDNQQ